MDFAVLASVDGNGIPYASRIGIAWAKVDQPMTLISDLATHTQHLKGSQFCSILLGDVAPKGDALTQPRATLVCRATSELHGSQGDFELRKRFVAQRPSSKVYAGFSDFHVFCFAVEAVDINGGFGKAYRLNKSQFEELALSAGR